MINTIKTIDLNAVITKGNATEFYRDLCGTVYGDADKTCQGVMSVEAIAEHMNLSFCKANAFCQAMIKFGVTECQGGMIVV